MARIYPSLGSLQNQLNSPNHGILDTPALNFPFKDNLNPLGTNGSAVFTRSTVGTYINRFGVVTTAAIDAPRFEKFGLLLESPSTNILKYSEDLSQSSVWKYNATYSSIATSGSDSAYLAPDNTTYSYKLLDTGENGIHNIYQDTTFAAPGSQTVYSASIFVKLASNTRTIRFILHTPDGVGHGGMGTEYYSFYADLLDGTIFNEQLSSNVDFTTSFLTPVYGGWYRVNLIARFPGTITGLRFETRLVYETYSGSVGTVYDENYPGTVGNPSAIYLWGAQLESSYYCTSYIKTTTVDVTRGSDNLYINTDNQFNYPTGQNTYIMDFDVLGVRSEDQRHLFSLGGFNYNLMRINTVGHHNAQYNATGYSDSIPIEANTVYRGAVRYDNGDMYLFRNGFRVAEKKNDNPQSNVFPSGRVYIGQNSFATQDLNGHISNFRIYDAALTDDEIRLV